MKIHASVFVAAAALAALLARPVVALDTDGVMATVKQYDDAFNKNDMKAWSALCTDNAIIIDDFAPHVWQGRDACGSWWQAFGGSAKDGGITNGMVTLGKPWHITVTGDCAYGVYPTQFAYKLKGKPILERGVWTFALQKVAAGWRITGWAWAQH